MSIKISGKKQTWDISGGQKEGRSYIVVDTNFATLREYVTTSPYNVEDSSGEQREQLEKHVKRLRGEISNYNYTPTVFNSSVSSLSQIIEDKDGHVQIKLDKDNKLNLIDGGHRLSALNMMRVEENQRRIDNLPIPLIIYLDPKQSKQNFVNLQKSLAVKKSHLLNMEIDDGRVDAKKLPYFRGGRELALLLHNTVESPFYKIIRFAGGSAPVEFSNVVTDRKSDSIGSLMLSARLLEINEQDKDWFNLQLNAFWKFIQSKTKCSEVGKLLCIPPSGPKTTVNLLLSAFNQYIYYLYLHHRTESTAKDLKLLKTSLEVFNQEVAGDLSTKRRSTLSREFGQILFKSIADDDDSTIGCHHGLPISLIILSAPSAFGVDSPQITSTKHAKSTVKPKADPTPTAKVETDTDQSFNDESIFEEMPSGGQPKLPF